MHVSFHEGTPEAGLAHEGKICQVQKGQTGRLMTTLRCCNEECRIIHAAPQRQGKPVIGQDHRSGSAGAGPNTKIQPSASGVETVGFRIPRLAGGLAINKK